MNTEVKSSYCIYEAADFSKESLPQYIKPLADNPLLGLAWSCGWEENEGAFAGLKRTVCLPASFGPLRSCSIVRDPGLSVCVEYWLPARHLLLSLSFSVYLNLLSLTRSPIICGTNLAIYQKDRSRQRDWSKWGKHGRATPFTLSVLTLISMFLVLCFLSRQ